MLNLGTLAIFTVLYFVRLILFLVYFVWYRFLSKNGKGKKFFESMRKELIFGEIISILIEAEFEFLISGYLNTT